MPTIEPNLHPISVHYVVALLSVSALLYLLSALGPQGWRASARIGGDWALGLGILSAAPAIAAGFYAYFTVAHDGPSHAAMTDHRNWALATAGAFVALATWRWLTRAQAPSAIFAIAAVAAAGLLTVTGYKGGELVFAHGLGVSRLPEAGAGDGHDHDHGPAAASAQASADDGHDHEHDHDAEEAGDAAASARTLADDGHDHVHEGEDSATDDAGAREEIAPHVDLSLPEGVVATFHEALEGGDSETVERLLDQNVVILEGGGSERSFEEYASHHLGADMAFLENMERVITRRDVETADDVAWVVTEGRVRGRFNDRDIDSATLETIILRRDRDSWRIVHIHWS